MKKEIMLRQLICICGLIVFIFQIGHSQFSFGALAGPNVYSNSQVNNFDNEFLNRTGFFISMLPSYQLTKNMSLRSELSYSEEGYKAVNKFSTGNDVHKMKFQYIRLIPQIEYNVWKGLSVFSGLNVGYLVDQKFASNNAAWQDVVAHTVHDFDYGISAGLRYFVHPFFLDFTWYNGLRDISAIQYTDESSNVIENTSQYNRTFRFGLGVMIF